MFFFPAHSSGDLPTPQSVAVSALIAGDASGLRVPVYVRAECPEPNFITVADYIAGWSRSYVIPVYSSRQAMMSPYSRSTVSITASAP